jgi:hypothetical protein
MQWIAKISEDRNISQKNLILVYVLIPIGLALIFGLLLFLANHNPKPRKLAKSAEWYFSMQIKNDLKIDFYRQEILFTERLSRRMSSRVSNRRSKRGSMVS